MRINAPLTIAVLALASCICAADKRSDEEVSEYLKKIRTAQGARDDIKRKFAPVKTEFDSLTLKIKTAKAIIEAGDKPIEELDAQAERLKGILLEARRNMGVDRLPFGQRQIPQSEREELKRQIEAKLQQKADAQQALIHATKALPELEKKFAAVEPRYNDLDRQFREAEQRVIEIEAEWKAPRVPKTVIQLDK